MAQASLGEQLCTQGPAFAVPAALAFYRALRVYPSPVELIMLYQSSLPPEVFAIILQLTNLDVSDTSSSEKEEGAEEAQQVEEQEQETSPERTGPPSEASSQDWDKLTDPGSQPGL